MIISAMISQCRREYFDIAKKVRMARQGDGSTNLFNLVNVPVIENSESITISGGAAISSANYTLDNDSGDLTTNTTPSAGHELVAEFKYAQWRDKNWVEAINQGIEQLNARGFFRQISRNTSLFGISANVRVYSAPSACMDVYELLESSDRTISGSFQKLGTNWSYQQDSNKIIFGTKPSTANKAAISYLRKLQTYAATTATVDVKDEWIEPVKKYAGSLFYQHMAGKKSLQGAATIEEGHFSFTNLRTQARDLRDDFDRFALRAKPTRPAKDIQWKIDTGGVA